MNNFKDVSPTVTLLIVSTVQFVVPFITSAMNVALPTIGRDLNASAVQLGLMVTVQVLAMAVFLLPAGRFADIYGRKKVFILGTATLAISTLGIGLISSIQFFLILRFIQGLGCAMIFSTSIAILTAVIPSERRGWALGISASMVYLGQSIGPSISGFVVDYLGWRWVFLIVFVAIVAALLLTLMRLKGEWTSAAGEPFDNLGAMIFMVSLCLLVFGASRITESTSAKWLCAGGIIGLVIFAIVEWKAKFPILDMRLLLTNLGFSFSNLATFLNYAAIMSFVFLFSFYLQYVKGLTPEQTGLLLFVQPILQTLFALISGKLSDRFPPSNIATIGMGSCAIGLFAAAQISPDTSYAHIVVVMVILGIGLGLFSTSNMTAIMGSVEPKHYGIASSMVSTMRTMGMLFSSTAIAVIFAFYLGDASVTSDNIPDFVNGMQTGLYLFCILSLLGTLFSISKGRLASGIETRFLACLR